MGLASGGFGFPCLQAIVSERKNISLRNALEKRIFPGAFFRAPIAIAAPTSFLQVKMENNGSKRRQRGGRKEEVKPGL